MPSKNYTFGAGRPTGGTEAIESQFSLMHEYRNRLVERERTRRAEADAVVRKIRPEVSEIEAAAVAASEKAKQSAGRLKEDNQVGSSRVDLQACKLEYSIVSPK